MIKRILLPLEPSPYTAAATDYSVDFARRHQAEITGLAVLDVPGIEKSEGSVPIGGIYYAEQVIAHKQKDAQKRIEELLQRFADRCKKEGVAYRLAKEQGAPVRRIVELSLYYDLVIMGLRTNYQFETEEGVEKSVEDVLDQTITPVLAVPEAFKPIRQVTIAFDGSFPAARALQRFAHLAIIPDIDIVLIHSNDDRKAADRILSLSAEYLRAYSARSVETVWTTDKIARVIEAEYLDRSDMVVLGVHSRSSIVEFVVGSLTKKLINFGKVPLFLGQ